MFRDVIQIIIIRFKFLWNQNRKLSNHLRRLILLSFFSILILGFIFVLSFKILTHFNSIPIIGSYLAKQMLTMSFVTIFGLVMFSAINSSLSTLYLSRDLELLHSSPISLNSLFFGKLFVAVFESSWMAVLFGIPIFSAYGYVYKPSIVFYFDLFQVVVCLCAIAGIIGTIVTTLLIYAIPGKRAKDLILILGILFFLVLYLVIRTLKPEQLVNPDTFMDVTEYLTALSSPTLAILPPRWAVDILWTKISKDENDSIIPLLLLYNTLAFLITFSFILAKKAYKPGYFKAQEGRERSHRGTILLNLIIKVLTFFYPMDMKRILEKDIKVFFRDNTQWTQLLLIGALVFVYIYNFSVLPLHKSPLRADYLQGIISFLNLGLASFVVSALCVRFVYTSISAEGEGFWIIKSSPIELSRFLVAKFLFYGGVLLILGEILVLVSNIFLGVNAIMMYLTCFTMMFLISGVVGLGIFFGARYAVFRYENLASVATGFGAYNYMMLAGALITVCIVIEAGPLYNLFMKRFRIGSAQLSDIIYLVASVSIVAIICLFVCVFSIKKAITIINEIEQI